MILSPLPTPCYKESIVGKNQAKPAYGIPWHNDWFKLVPKWKQSFHLIVWGKGLWPECQCYELNYVLQNSHVEVLTPNMMMAFGKENFESWLGIDEVMRVGP
jgi:hypothetical protein